MKAMILAAGRGLRMGSLTDKLPKPLIPIAGQPVIAHQLLKLAKAGVREIVINVSYRAEQIMATLGKGDHYGVSIEYSYEPSALETGGGIVNALSLLGAEPFMVLSADIYTNYPLERLLNLNLGHTHAHLVLVDNPSYHEVGDFHLQQDTFLNLTQSPKLTFANLGVYHSRLFQDYKTAVFPLSKVLKQAILQQKITGEYYTDQPPQQAIWFNLGSADELKKLEIHLKTIP